MIIPRTASAAQDSRERGSDGAIDPDRDSLAGGAGGTGARGPVWRTETWRRDAEGRLTGLIHSGLSRAGGPAPAQEAELVISGRGRAMRLTYRPADGATVRYRLVRNERWEAVFESIGSGSPRIISYRSADGLRLDVMHGLET
jgi:hypothetical protein